MKNSKNITNAKYVVETCCTNGNIFLHGPFKSKTAAENWCSSDACEYTMENCNKISIRMVAAPNGWTRSVK